MKHLFGRADERVQAERRQRRPERRVVRRNRRLAAEPRRARVARPARQPHDRLAPHGHARRFRIERDRRPADTQRDENHAEGTTTDLARVLPGLAARVLELQRVGYGQHEAVKIAMRIDVDLHLAVDLLRQGCPTKTALQILL